VSICPACQPGALSGAKPALSCTLCAVKLWLDHAACSVMSMRRLGRMLVALRLGGAAEVGRNERSLVILATAGTQREAQDAVEALALCVNQIVA
jgi:hypothetical protein